MPQPYFLPAGIHLDLLLAAFHPDRAAALEAWWRWRSQTTLEACEFCLHRLLPLIFRRFEREPIDPQDLNVLRGVYRFNWTRNQLLARSASRIIHSLQTAGVEVLVLKGLALAHLAYADVGTRPMHDFDLLIRPQQRPLALTVLQREGWTSSHPVPDLRAQHACEFVQPGGQQLDLHWFATPESRWSDVDDGFWQRSRPLQLQALSTRALGPGDALVHLCIHAMKDGADALGWVCDACTLLRAEPDLDWQLLVDESRRRRMVLSLAMALGYLQDSSLAHVPPPTLRQLRTTPVAWPDQLYFASKVRGGGGWSRWARPYLEFVRCERPGSYLDWLGFLHFLKRRWGLSRIRQIPARALARWLQGVGPG